MPPPVIPWTHSVAAVAGVAPYPSAFVTPADFLAGLHALVQAEAQHWEVAFYNAVAGVLVLRPDDGGDFRLMYFGGSSPNVAAVGPDVTLNAGGVYLGFSMLGVDEPTAAYTGGAPFTDWRYGGIVRGTLVSTHTRLRLHELGSQALFVSHYEAGALCGCTGAGMLLVDPDGETLRTFVTSGGLAASSIGGAARLYEDFWNPGTGSSGQAPFDSARSSTQNQPNTHASLFDTAARIANMTAVPADGAANSLRRGTLRYFVPLLMRRLTAPFDYCGKIRQMAMGPRAVNGEEYDEAGGGGDRIARAISGLDGAAADAIWLTDFAV